MKNLIFLLVLAFSLSSCKAQQATPIENQSLDLMVMYVENGVAGLFHPKYGKTFKGEANGLTNKDVNREYNFILERRDCKSCKVIDVVILAYSVTPLQADKDIEKNKREYHIAAPKQ